MNSLHNGLFGQRKGAKPSAFMTPEHCETNTAVFHNAPDGASPSYLVDFEQMPASAGCKVIGQGKDANAKPFVQELGGLNKCFFH